MLGSQVMKWGEADLHWMLSRELVKSHNMVRHRLPLVQGASKMVGDSIKAV